MSFLFPLGLLALLALPVVLLLHLIRERRRRVVVPSLLHWLRVPQKPTPERARRLPLSLLLLLHLLIAGVIGLAVARPQIFSGLLGRADQIAIVLDTSTSMLARDGAQTRFAEAQDRARTLLRGMSPGGHATIIAAGSTARVIASGGLNDLARMEAALDAAHVGGTVASMDAALVQAEAALDLTRPASIVVLSDGAASMAQRTMAAPVDWQVVGSAAPNRAILAFATRPQGSTTQLYARIANYDSAPWSGEVHLYDGDQRVDTSPVSIDANGEAEVTWKLHANTGTLRAEIAGNDSLSEDDQAYANVATARPLAITLVTQTPEPLQRALAAVAGAKITVVEPANFTGSGSQANADLTVFDSFVPPAWPAGAALVINPPEANPLLPVQGTSTVGPSSALSQRGATLAGLTLDTINFGLVKRIAPPDWAQTLLESQPASANGAAVPLVMRGTTEGHDITVWSFDVHVGNLANRLAFPLLVGRTVRDLTPSLLPEMVQAGTPLLWHPSPRAQTVQITAPDGSATSLPAAPTLTLDTLAAPGWYRVAEQGPGGTVYQGQIAVNAGSVAESDLRVQNAPTLQSGPSIGAQMSERLSLELLPWLALAALILLTLEWGYVHR